MKPWSQSKIVQGCEKLVTDPETCETGPSNKKSRNSFVKRLLHTENLIDETIG